MGSNPIYSDELYGMSPSGKAMVFDIISIGSIPIILKVKKKNDFLGTDFMEYDSINFIY